jgi:3',5'-cyclic AMP phosphodiesterase CpdA
MRLRSILLAVPALWLAGARAHATEYSYVQASEGGKMACATVPAGWQRGELDDASWPEREFPPPLPDGGVPDGGVAPGPSPDAGTGCAGAMFLRYHFDVGPELARLATATLRIRYAHGFAAYLNGVEIARRRLDANAAPMALANDYHGPEAERVFVPLRPGLLRTSGNVLAIEVHPRSAGKTPFAEVELGGADGVRIVRGPYLQRLSGTEVTVVFDTDLPTLAEARWGLDDTYGAITTDAPPQRHHALRLTGLKPGTQYHYRVAVRAAPAAVALSKGLPLVEPVDGGDAAFHTLPEPGRPLRFAVYGDVRSGHDVHALLNQSLIADDPDLAILTGDLVDRGSDEGDWEKFFDVAGQLLRGLAIFPSAGNHEYARLGHGATNFLQLFRWPLRAGDEDAGYYSFDAAGAHFVALDSNQYRSPRQLAWLDHDLARAEQKGARALFVYAHEPPYSTGLHGDNPVAIHDYVPVMERHHVTMFFGGHDHHYERGRVGTLDYVITGGGGAELRTPRCGVPGKKPCPPHVAAFFNEHHYVLVELLPGLLRVCPKRPDGTPLETCVTYPVHGD